MHKNWVEKPLPFGTMTGRNCPYIGFTGFTTPEEVQLANTLFSRLTKIHDTDHLFMVGVLASAKSLRGETNPKYPGRYPKPTDIANIFQPKQTFPLALNLIHYANRNPATQEDELKQLIELGGPHLHGFQLNITWPDPKMLRRVIPENMRVIIQLNDSAMKLGDDPTLVPQRVAEELDKYASIATDVLIDASGGMGKELDRAHSVALACAISERHPMLNVGVAGGLTTKNLHLIDPIAGVLTLNDLSIDTEGKHRNSDDSLNLTSMADYLFTAVKKFSLRSPSLKGFFFFASNLAS